MARSKRNVVHRSQDFLARALRRPCVLLPNWESAVSQPQQSTVRNRLLKRLSEDDFALLQPNLEPMATELRQTLIKPNEQIKHLFFPEVGYASITTGGS